MQKTIFLASTNSHKKEEIEVLLKHPVVLPSDRGINFEVDEIGAGFSDNALLKANFLLNKGLSPVLADDSGLIIEAMPGELGVHSARFKAELTQPEKNNFILKQLQNCKQREARFICALVFATDLNNFIIVQASLEGVIAQEQRGHHGFGYDPIFLVPEYGKTLAELNITLKNKISHRAKAFDNLNKLGLF